MSKNVLKWFIFQYLFIYIASENGSLVTVKLLIEKEADMNEKNKDGYTALILGKQQNK